MMETGMVLFVWKSEILRILILKLGIAIPGLCAGVSKLSQQHMPLRRRFALLSPWLQSLHTHLSSCYTISTTTRLS